MKKIAVLDLTSRTLPYCFFYVKSISKFVSVDFYCSKTTFNSEFISHIQSLSNVNVIIVGNTQNNRLARVFSYVSSIIRCKFGGYAAINLQWSAIPRLDQFVLKLFGNKLVFTIHNDVPHDFEGKVYEPYKRIANFAKRIIFVSQTTKTIFLQNYGESLKSKSVLLPHGQMPFVPAEEVVVKNKYDVKHLIFWGNVKNYKGVDMLASSHELFHQQGLKVSVIGKFDSDQIYLKEKLIKVGINVRDEFVAIDELRELFKRNDIALILPYKKATQSGVVYNAIYYKVPFICSNTGETPNILRRSGLESFIFERESDTSIKQAIQNLKRNINKKDYLTRLAYELNWLYSAKLIQSAFDL